MIKYLFIFLFSVVFVGASPTSDALKARILNTIISGVEHTKVLKIWSDNKKITEALYNMKKYKIVLTCKEADIIILEKKENLSSLCLNRNIFVLNYNLLTEIPQSFGAFFWKKGRPNIVFIESRLEKRGLHLSNKLTPYIEERVW